jgi:hypothetical protein
MGPAPRPRTGPICLKSQRTFLKNFLRRNCDLSSKVSVTLNCDQLIQLYVSEKRSVFLTDLTNLTCCLGRIANLTTELRIAVRLRYLAYRYKRSDSENARSGVSS